MSYLEHINFRDLQNHFRDDEQQQAVRDVVHSRLADDRKQEECRYLMRFWWQLSMSYREVTLQELESFVSTEKLRVIMELLCALEQGYGAIDDWVERYTQELPVIEDRSFENYEAQDLG